MSQNNLNLWLWNKCNYFCLENIWNILLQIEMWSFQNREVDHVITAHVMIMWQSRDGSDCRKEGQVGSKGDQSDLKS